MKKGLLQPTIAACLLFFLLQGCASQKFSPGEGDIVPLAVANEMIDNYEGLLRNHKKSDGMLISADELTQILQSYQGQTIGLVFARYLKGDPSDSRSKRATLLLKTFPNGIKSLPVYRDLGKGRICPEPQNCDPVQ